MSTDEEISDFSGITADIARQLLQAQFPRLAPHRVEYLGEGSDSVAFDVNDSWIFRFPKRRYVEAQLLIETAILPVLAPSLPVAVPAFRFHGQPGGGFPFHFAGYAKLPGKGADEFDRTENLLATMSPALGTFLSRLHAFPVVEATRLGVRTEHHDSIQEIRASALDQFARVRTVAAGAPLERWYAYLRDGADALAPSRAHPVLVHNDLSAEHMLLDAASGQLTGIIDWGDIAIGDAAVDFAGLLHWGGESFLRAVLIAYGETTSAGFLARVRYLAACRAVRDVALGVETGRHDLVSSGLLTIDLVSA